MSIEATGAWDSDWQLPRDLETAGARLLRIWVCAALEVTLDRLAHRTSRKAPSTAEEARLVYSAAVTRARYQTFDLNLDTEVVQPDDLADALAPLTSSMRR